MLLWILALLLVLAASGLLAGFVTLEMIPQIAEAFGDGEAVSVMLSSFAALAIALIALVGVLAVPMMLYSELRRRLAESKLVAAWHERRLRQNAVTSAEPVTGVKLANVHWHATDQEPAFSGASGGSAYRRDDTAQCEHSPTDRLCVDQHTRHRCGFYALPTGNELLAELTGLSQAQAVESYDWRDALEPFDETTHVVTVALHGEVMAYDAGVRGQRQTVTAIDLPAVCTRDHCEGPVDAVAALGSPGALCALHAASPDLAGRTLSLEEFARRFDIALRPTTPTGRPAPRAEGQRDASGAGGAEGPSADTPVEHRSERIEGWLAGSFDVERGHLITETHLLSAGTRAADPVTAARHAPTPPPGQALARVRLGGEVVVRRQSISSHDVQVWDLYLPDQCQHAGCHQPAELVDRDGSLAVTRCRSHASPLARPAAQYGADHGMAIQLGS